MRLLESKVSHRTSAAEAKPAHNGAGSISLAESAIINGNGWKPESSEAAQILADAAGTATLDNRNARQEKQSDIRTDECFPTTFSGDGSNSPQHTEEGTTSTGKYSPLGLSDSSSDNDAISDEADAEKPSVGVVPTNASSPRLRVSIVGCPRRTRQRRHASGCKDSPGVDVAIGLDRWKFTTGAPPNESNDPHDKKTTHTNSPTTTAVGPKSTWHSPPQIAVGPPVNFACSAREIRPLNKTETSVEFLSPRSSAAIRPLTTTFARCFFGRTRSRLIGKFARLRWPRTLSSKVFPWLLSYWQCQQAEYIKPFDQFESIADLFSRKIRPEARPLASRQPDSLVSPCDGTVVALQVISDLSSTPWISQVKGARYHVDTFVGENLSQQPMGSPNKWSPGLSPSVAPPSGFAESSRITVPQLEARCAACGSKRIDRWSSKIAGGHISDVVVGFGNDRSPSSGGDDILGHTPTTAASPRLTVVEDGVEPRSLVCLDYPGSLHKGVTAAPVETTPGIAADSHSSVDLRPLKHTGYQRVVENATMVTGQLSLSPFEVDSAELRWFQATVYLSPRNYHHFHSPCDWTVVRRRHFAGEVIPVCKSLASRIPNLFAVNERVILSGIWRHGRLFYGAVAAFNVADIRLKFEEFSTNLPGATGICHTARYPPSEECCNELCPKCRELVADLEIGEAVSRGEEIGEFRLGSTVVLLFQAPKTFSWAVNVGDAVKMGELLGQAVPHAP